MKTSPRPVYTQPVMVAFFQLASVESPHPLRASTANVTKVSPALSCCGLSPRTRTRRSEGGSLARENLLCSRSFAASGWINCASTSETAVGGLLEPAEARLDARTTVAAMNR